MKIMMIVAALMTALGLYAMAEALAQPRTMPSSGQVGIQVIRTNLACIYMAGSVQTGLSIAAVAHDGKDCN